MNLLIALIPALLLVSACPRVRGWPFQIVASNLIAVARCHNPDGGEAFVAVLGPNGQATLKKWGFLPSSGS